MLLLRVMIAHNERILHCFGSSTGFSEATLGKLYAVVFVSFSVLPDDWTGSWSSIWNNSSWWDAGTFRPSFHNSSTFFVHEFCLAISPLLLLLFSQLLLSPLLLLLHKILLLLKKPRWWLLSGPRPSCAPPDDLIIPWAYLGIESTFLPHLFLAQLLLRHIPPLPLILPLMLMQWEPVSLFSIFNFELHLIPVISLVLVLVPYLFVSLKRAAFGKPCPGGWRATLEICALIGLVSHHLFVDASVHLCRGLVVELLIWDKIVRRMRFI